MFPKNLTILFALLCCVARIHGTSTFLTNHCNEQQIKAEFLDALSFYQQGKIVELSKFWELDGKLQVPGASGNLIVGRQNIFSFFQSSYAGGIEFFFDINDVNVQCLPGTRFAATAKLFYKPPGGIFTPTSSWHVGILNQQNEISIAQTGFGQN